MGKIERLAELSAEDKEKFKYTHFTEITMWDKINELVDSVNDMEYIHDLSPAHKKEPEKPLSDCECKECIGKNFPVCREELANPKPSPEKPVEVDSNWTPCVSCGKIHPKITLWKYCPFCAWMIGNKPEPKPSPTSLLQVICKWNNTRGSKQEYEELAQAIRQYLSSMVEGLSCCENCKNKIMELLCPTKTQ